MTSIPDGVKRRKRTASIAFRFCREYHDAPHVNNEIQQVDQLRAGKLVWVLWDNDKWYIGIICLTPRGQIYCQYYDRDQHTHEDLEELARGSKVREETNKDVVRHMQDNIKVFPLDPRHETADDTDDDDGIEEEEEEDQDIDKEEEEDLEVIEVVEEEEEEEEEEIVKSSLEEEDVEVLAVKEEDDARKQVYYSFFEKKFGKEFGLAFVAGLKKKSSNKYLRSIIFNFGAGRDKKDKVPTISRQIQEGRLKVEDILEMAERNTLKEPEQLQQQQQRDESNALKRMRPDAAPLVMYNGTLIDPDQLPSKN